MKNFDVQYAKAVMLSIMAQLYMHINLLFLLGMVIPYLTDSIEGTNNKIKVLKRQMYGFWNDEFFTLKLYDLTTSVYAFNGRNKKYLTYRTFLSIP